ncbi:MAG: TetR/AcrR family transcriptional regulator [Lachnospiraceae bacterium]|nr:TetR/AcrR family transcriptional regulator [Lachnospiraceae bacterium]
MPPKPKYTKDQLIDAAVDIIRKDGIKAITAQSLAAILHVTPPSVFSHFDTVEDIREAAIERSREIYDSYVKKGLALNPPFKGFAMQFVQFAVDEPMLFQLLFMSKKNDPRFEEYSLLEGHTEFILKAIKDTFPLTDEECQELYIYTAIFTHGIASMTATGACTFSQNELAELLGKSCRGFLMAIHAPEDAHTDMIPKNGGRVDRVDAAKYLRRK